jgi:hypothetical protein
MSELTIKTDHKWKAFRYRNEVPRRVLERDFDYQDEDDATDGFFKYRGVWYHLDQFMRFGFPFGGHPEDSPFKDWHAYAGDSFFSGVVIRVSSDGEQYQVGTYYS